jgi:hypothetical protein
MDRMAADDAGRIARALTLLAETEHGDVKPLQGLLAGGFDCVWASGGLSSYVLPPR